MAQHERTARGWVILVSPILAMALAVGLLTGGGFSLVLLIKPRPSRAQIAAITHLVLTNYFGQMALTLLVYFALFATIWLLLPKRGNASLRSYFWRLPARTLLGALASGVVFAMLVGLTLQLLVHDRLVVFHPTPSEQALLPRSYAQLTVALLTVSVVAPLVEELYFRGLLLRWLLQRMRLSLAAVPDALLFAAIHFRFATHVGIEGWIATGALFVFGLLAVAWAGATRSLWPAILAHGAYNGILIAAPMLAGRHAG